MYIICTVQRHNTYIYAVFTSELRRMFNKQQNFLAELTGFLEKNDLNYYPLHHGTTHLVVC